MINITKLVKYNLSAPYEKRIGYLELLEKTQYWKARANVSALYVSIKSEIDKSTAMLDNKWEI